MGALEDFENTLREFVNAKRPSASKMNILTEIAMKSLADDTKLVAILYRTHKSLPSTSKVPSLYAFDALARAARSLMNKRGITGDVKLEKGNAATFLLKIEGVLDGLFQDMASLSNPEAKEKTKKVLEIWLKSNTFPSAVLTRLRDILSDIQKETAVNPTPPTTTDVPVMITSQTAPLTSTAAPADVQATLLALLGKAAQVTDQGQSLQTPSNSDPQLQLALLQQLALTAKLAGSSTPPSGQTPPPLTDGNPSPVVIPAPEPSHPPLRHSQAAGSRFDVPGDARYGRNGYPDRPRDRHDFRDERYPRGGFRGRGRRDDYHNRDRFRHRERDWDPLLHQRRSRSRSPRRHEEWRKMRSSSPPRPSLTDGEVHPLELPTSTHGKDEFGRDIRVSSSSPSRSMSVEDTRTLAPVKSSVDSTPGDPPDYRIPVSDQLPLVAASTSAQSTEPHTPSPTSQQQQQQPGLDQFDIATFDATHPSSWEALGNMWQSTYGCPPSQEELMHFVMTGSMAAAGMANGTFNGTQGGQWQQGNWEDHGSSRGGWRGGRGRGNYAGGRGGHGNFRDEGEYANAMDDSEPSYTVVVNGDAESNEPLTEQNEKNEAEDVLDGKASGKGVGRMQRVGDKWMFVRDGEPGTATA